MKIAIISDLHFGNKKNDEIFLNNALNVFNNEIIPYLKKNKIKDIYILGDIFDSRNTINIKIKNAVYNLFDINLKDFNIIMILGNHDIFYKNSTAVHSLKMFKKFSNVEVIEDIALKIVDNRKFLFVPWQLNYDEFKTKVTHKNIHCDVCFGHFDINECYMNKLSTLTKDGLPKDLFFNNYNITFSGHFHSSSKTVRGHSEIVYVGTPYELNRNDRNEPKGFCILDTDTMTYEFVDNKKYLKFTEIVYPNKPSAKLVTGNIVDVHVTIDNAFSDTDYNMYLKQLNALNPVNINIITKYAIFNEVQQSTQGSTFGVKTTMESIKDYIDTALDLCQDDKTLIYNKMESIYNESRGL